MEVPNLLETEISLADHYLEMKRLPEAEIHIINALQLDPSHPEALYTMACILHAKDDYMEARKLCEQALKNGYDQGACYYLIGSTYEEEKNYTEAESAYLKFLKNEPDSGFAHAVYGSIMLTVGQKEKAFALLEEAMRLDPENERVTQEMLHYAFATSDKKNQQVLLQNLMENGSSEIRKLVNLAVYHQLKDENKIAKEYFVQAYLMDPSNEKLLQILEDHDRSTHPIFFYEGPMMKIGGPIVIWLSFIVLLFLFKTLNLVVPLAIVVCVYLAFVVYTWLSAVLYKVFVKGKWLKRAVAK
ncbi:tetratricopeptide repeat protein [Chungangia koreensis]|uniref:Tetratricopeptide repeat protein n=1 Tax=Chungangia koreensis TaxID=752657 RepID=A0ABV8X5M6_9LACT